MKAVCFYIVVLIVSANWSFGQGKNVYFAYEKSIVFKDSCGFFVDVKTADVNSKLDSAQLTELHGFRGLALIKKHKVFIKSFDQLEILRVVEVEGDRLTLSSAEGIKTGLIRNSKDNPSNYDFVFSKLTSPTPVKSFGGKFIITETFDSIYHRTRIETVDNLESGLLEINYGVDAYVGPISREYSRDYAIGKITAKSVLTEGHLTYVFLDQNGNFYQDISHASDFLIEGGLSESELNEIQRSLIGKWKEIDYSPFKDSDFPRKPLYFDISDQMVMKDLRQADPVLALFSIEKCGQRAHGKRWYFDGHIELSPSGEFFVLDHSSLGDSDPYMVWGFKLEGDRLYVDIYPDEYRARVTLVRE